MKTALLTVLAVPLFIAIPVVAQASPPPQIFTPQQECDATKAMVQMERKKNPHFTPQQMTDDYMTFLDQQGAFNGLPPASAQGARQRQREYLLSHISSCHLA